MPKRSLPLLIALFLVVMALAVALPANAQTPTVTGTVTYRVRTALPSDAIVTVRLSDVSKADAPAELISEQKIPTEGKQVPFAYTLPYDASKIVDNHSYAVSARIESGGQLLFISTRQYGVITRGNPTENVEIVVEPVGAPTTQPANLPTSGGSLLAVGMILGGVLVGAGAGMRRGLR